MYFTFSHDRPIVQGWLPASPAEAKAVPREGPSALVSMMYLCLQILSDLKDGGVQGWVYWQVRSLSSEQLLVFEHGVC